MELREDLNPDVDAEFVITFAASGAFDGAEAFDTTQVVTVACEGPECDDVDAFLGATLPCDVTYAMGATAQ